jgi:hypothetical protein
MKHAYRIAMPYEATAKAKALTLPSLRVRVRSMERRTIPEPVVRSPRWAAIEAAVERVMAARKATTREPHADKVVSEKNGARSLRKSK